MSALWAVLRHVVGRGWANRWVFSVPVATFLLPATIYALSLPEVFLATSTLHVKPLTSESAGYALPQEGIVRAEEVMATLRDRVFTRQNLAAAMPILAPDANPEDPALIERLALAFEYEQVGPAAFSIGLEKPSPTMARDAVNAVTEAFLEGVRSDRLRRALHNQTFHEDELKEAVKLANTAHEALKLYRARHRETLPGRKDAINMELRQLGTDRAALTGTAMAQRTRVTALEEQIIGLESQPLGAATTQTSPVEEALALRLGEEQRSLNTLEGKLADAASRYTERHPKLIQLRAAVEAQRKAVAQTLAALTQERNASRGRVNDSREAQLERRRSRLVALKVAAREQLAQTVQRTEELETREEQLHAFLSQMEQTIAGLDPLLRAYEDTTKAKDSAQRSVSQAKLAVAFYEKQDASDVTGFSVTAWAVAPVQPSGPGRWRYLLSAIAFGLLVGYGILVVRHRYQGATISRGEDLAGLFPSAVVVNVPLLGAGRSRPLGHRLGQVALTVYVVALVGLSVFFLAAHKGWVTPPEWVQGFLGGRAA